jgi:DNA polymerase III alpha subunit
MFQIESRAQMSCCRAYAKMFYDIVVRVAIIHLAPSLDKW